AECDLENAGASKIRQDCEGFVSRPSALGVQVARAKGAGQIALVRDAKHDRTRREHTERHCLRAIKKNVGPGFAVEKQECRVKRKRAKRHSFAVPYLP